MTRFAEWWLPALAAVAACTPPAPEHDVDVDDGPLHLHASTRDGTVVITQAGQVVAAVDLSLVAFRASEAVFDMQYGMFDIREFPEDWRTTARLRTSRHRPFVLVDGSGADLGELRVLLRGDGHVRLEFVADDARMNRARIALDCAATEHFAGFGAQTHDVDHRGQRVPLWVSEQGIGKVDHDELPTVWQVTGRRHTSQVPIPAYVSSRGVAVVADTYAYSVFDLCREREDRVIIETWEGTLRLDVYAGPTPLDALARLTADLGRPRLPPPWALAPWNDALFGTDNVLAFAHWLREQRIPSSAIWSEDWKGAEWNGDHYTLSENWDLDPVLYPRFSAMIVELKSMGFSQQLYRNPFLYLDADAWREAKDLVVMDTAGDPWKTNGATFTDTAFLDLTSPAARTWVLGKLLECLDTGALGWMADFAEWMPVDDAVTADGSDPALVHNRYPVLWQEVNNEALRLAGRLDDAVVYYRSGHLRSQGLAQVMWAGDQRTDFQADDGLPTVLPIGLGLAATGFPFFAHDIGGYQSSTNPPADKELYFRWTELGALTPVMRTHHGTHPRLQWNLRSDEETTAHYKRYAELHVRLYPYLRALAHAAVEQGRPMWIPMGFKHPSDPTAWAVKDQYCLGEALLVAPVVTRGATNRDVYLPAGRWVPWLDGGAALDGGRTVNVPAPLVEIPVFIAAGGLVPMTAAAAQTLFPGDSSIPGLETTEGDRVLHVGLGAPGAFMEESGASYALTGTGTDVTGLTREADGAVIVDGNGTIAGGGFTLMLAGHPTVRRTRVYFR
ncbi:MAG: hypothetical protein HY904_23285 [Deltaproteobacteria bacterium]|nr:hypothetical protein [Deltaproteobacteria bacterium]